LSSVWTWKTRPSYWTSVLNPVITAKKVRGAPRPVKEKGP
jgi:hypothetical protein